MLVVLGEDDGESGVGWEWRGEERDGGGGGGVRRGMQERLTGIFKLETFENA